jgi:transposase
MISSLKALRATVEASRTSGGRLRRASQLEVASAIERARSEGASYAAIAVALGVTQQTLKRWRSSDAGSSLALIRVVDPAPVARAVTVHGPRGVRIEGLTLDEIAALLVRLS